MDFHLKINSVSCNVLAQTWVVAFESGFHSPGEQEWPAGLHVVLLRGVGPPLEQQMNSWIV